MNHGELDDLPVFCEKCGYHLNALPATVCPACAMVGLRCPECGHRQHANSARPAVIRAIGRLRGVFLVLAALMRTTLCGVVAMIWAAAGTDSHRLLASPSQMMGHSDYLLIGLGAVLSTLGLRMVLVPAKWRILPPLLATLIPAGGFVAGMWISLPRSQATDLSIPLTTFARTLLPWMVAGAVLGGMHVRLLSWAMWPPPAQRLLGRWRRCSGMPRVNLDAVNLPAQSILSEPLPLFCEQCAAPIHREPVQSCDACSLPSVKCPRCGRHVAVRSVRPVVEKALAHSAANVLHLLTFLGTALLYIGLFGWFVFGYETARMMLYRSQYANYARYQDSAWIELMIASAFAALFGFVWRVILLRWRWGVVTGLAAAGITGAAIMTGTWCELTAQRKPWSLGTLSQYEFTRALMGVMVMAWAGCAVGWPIIRVFVQLFTPKRLSQRLLAWRQSGWGAELIALDGEATPEAPAGLPIPKPDAGAAVQDLVKA
jgi:hypothetical protein